MEWQLGEVAGKVAVRAVVRYNLFAVRHGQTQSETVGAGACLSQTG